MTDDIEITTVHSGNIDRYKKRNDNNLGRETGFPSPARDYYEKPLSLDEHLIRRPAATYFVRLKGNNLNNIGIYSEDILVVDRSIKPVSGHLVIVRLDGRNTVRKLERRGEELYFCTGKSDDLHIDEELDYEIWGVVSYTIHKQI